MASMQKQQGKKDKGAAPLFDFPSELAYLTNNPNHKAGNPEMGMQSLGIPTIPATGRSLSVVQYIYLPG